MCSTIRPKEGPVWAEMSYKCATHTCDHLMCSVLSRLIWCLRNIARALKRSGSLLKTVQRNHFWSLWLAVILPHNHTTHMYCTIRHKHLPNSNYHCIVYSHFQNRNSPQTFCESFQLCENSYNPSHKLLKWKNISSVHFHSLSFFLSLSLSLFLPLCFFLSLFLPTLTSVVKCQEHTCGYQGPVELRRNWPTS